MNIQTNFFSYKTTSDQTKKETLNAYSNLKINNNLKNNSVSFGAVDFIEIKNIARENDLIKATLDDMFKILSNSVEMSLKCIIETKKMDEKSWHQIKKIIKKNNFDQLNITDKNSKNSIINISAEPFKSIDITTKEQKLTDQILLEFDNGNTFFVYFKKPESGVPEEIYINGTVINKNEHISRDYSELLDEEDLSNIKNKIISIEPKRYNVLVNIFNYFKLNKIEPLDLNAIKIKSEEITSYKLQETINDLYEISKILKNDALNIGSISPFSTNPVKQSYLEFAFPTDPKIKQPKKGSK